MTDLVRWNVHLAQHFAKLQTTRHATGGDRPIFALEHGLEPSEIQAVSKAVRAWILSKPPSRDDALPWVVYAAEIGYRYSGDEYWQTFEAETPGWTENGDRDWMRNCYRSFQKTYGGAEPSGAWAAHFSIICWPITHAILPRDLQRQLARILYELRHSFSAELFESPTKLGEFIAARSWNATSRFQNLAQETRLVGQIAAALLLQGEFGTDSLIHPGTLNRIGTDLDSERRAREWLRGARRFAQERARIRGLALGRDTTTRRTEEAQAEIAALGIEPRLVLRPKDAARVFWEASLEIPDLSHLLLRFPNTRDILTGSRCIVAGASGRPLARGRCLHGAQRVGLSRWPRGDEVLLRFEQTDAQLEYLLRTECLLRPGPIWLFRVASDGLAYESRGLRVRAGERYILVTTSGPVQVGAHARSIDIQCEGVQAVMLDIPPAITADWEEALRLLGLAQAKTIEVWPVGLGAVVWDGEGHGEWLASERPCLAIRTDHPLAEFIVSMNTTAVAPLELESVIAGEPIFVELPQLPVGLHTFSVSARTAGAGEAELLGDLDVVMRVREARPWFPGVSPHGPLVVEMDPVVPTLEQLWEGRIEITLRGPVGRRALCTLSFFETDRNVATVVKRLPPITLPLNPDDWRTHFEKYFRATKEAQTAYDAARCCDLEFSAEELGMFTVRCEREFTPLRWLVRRSGPEYTARLLDDGGEVKPPQIARLAFETPCVEELLDHAPSYKVASLGGLYFAKRGEFTASVIIPPDTIPVDIREWSRVRRAPHIDATARSAESVIRILSIARRWSEGNLSGDLFSAMRRRDVLLALVHHVVRMISGERWAQAELKAGSGVGGLIDLQSAVPGRHDPAEISSVLARQYVGLATDTCEERVRTVAELSRKYLVGAKVHAGDSDWLAELALRLASDPAGVESWAGQRLHVGVTRLLEMPALMRAARFIVIATDLHLQSRTMSRELYASWRWT